ncbi:MAG: hypothetical protein ABI863_18780 [Ginsengibacter sp.]
MRYSLQSIIIVLICVALVSCQKKYLELEYSPPPVVVAHDSIMRLSAYYFYSISGAVRDTFRYQELFYDSPGRVQTMKVYLNNTGPNSLFWVTTFNYRDTESIAYEKIERFPTLTGNDTLQTYFYYYDNLRRLIKDSINYPNEVQVDTYKYSSSMITASRSYVFNVIPFTQPTEIDTGFESSTGDVTKLSMWYTNGATVNSVVEFSYDDKPNPFYQLNIHSTFRPIFDLNDMALNLDFYLQRNNIVNVFETIAAVPPTLYNTVYTYSYNTAGLPVTQYNSTWRNDPGGDWIGFVYKKM